MNKNPVKLALSPEAIEHWGLSKGEKLSLALGKKTVKVMITQGESSTEPEYIYIDWELARVMGVPEGIRLNLKKQGKTLRMGPLIGILAGRYSKERASFGSQNSFFRSLLASLRDLNGIGFIFCPSDINSERKSIYGYYIMGKTDERWKRMRFPFPDVCYNRHASDGSSPGSYHSITLLTRHGVKSFNSSIGSKWAVHKLLLSHRDIAPHLPETHLLNSGKVLLSMIKKHHEVYLKPPSGCKGRGIMRVSRKKGAYLLKTYQSNSYLCRSAQEVLQKTRGRMNCTMPIAQQSIRLPGNGKHIDFRVLVQKDRFNQWSLTGIAARIGVDGQITTNLHAGGKAQDAQTSLLDRGFTPEQIVSINNKLEELALKIAVIIDSKYRTLGELGLDFLVDKKGKVWFLEANPRPGRRSFKDISAELRRIAVSRPMEYACFLAGF